MMTAIRLSKIIITHTIFPWSILLIRSLNYLKRYSETTLFMIKVCVEYYIASLWYCEHIKPVDRQIFGLRKCVFASLRSCAHQPNPGELSWQVQFIRVGLNVVWGKLNNWTLVLSKALVSVHSQGSFLMCHFLRRRLEEEKLASCDAQNECQGTNIDTFGWSSVSSESAVSRSATSLLQVSSLEIRVSLLSCVIWPWGCTLPPPESVIILLKWRPRWK